MQKILLAIIASAVVVAMLPAFGTLTAFGKGQPGTCAVGSNSGCTPPGTGCGSPGTSTPPGQTGQSQSPFAPVITGSGTQSVNHYANGANHPNPTANSQYDVACQH